MAKGTAQLQDVSLPTPKSPFVAPGGEEPGAAIAGTGREGSAARLPPAAVGTAVVRCSAEPGTCAHLAHHGFNKSFVV